MANIKTATLTAGTELTVTIGGTHTIVTNRTGGVLYASANSGITADADGVMYIADGASDIITGTNGTVYLLSAGGGKVQCVGTDYANQNFNRAVGGSGSALTADGTTITNTGGVISANYAGENLLCNPDFLQNQRGQTTYTGAVYTVDRWCKNYAGTVTVNSDRSITISDDTYFKQAFENTEKNIGKTVTASVNVGGVIYSGSGIVSDTGNTAVLISSGNVIITLQWINELLWFVVRGGVTLSWVKLEIGSAATPFVPPNPADELARCQRYYQIRSTNDIVAVDLRPTMRTTPTDIVAVTGGYAYVAEL